ncbi:glutamate--tRNA ligase [Gleimia coleocanis DSM 15436]|uniref:Glutamate--tRNA ligase n=2 Tax=Gleimia TaxID=2692113 RepID=C0W155_9ACTO|nr:glutamate--tRNA ligase [Gleimia coleocanis DSM 15436]
MVRTCLFNWAWARHVGGTFVFRIEDTDAARDSEESFNQIIDSLTWLGLDWDEGILKGGPHEPYRQSQRMDIYKDVAEKLLAAGYAYESWSTPEEIEARHRAAGRDPKLGYDGFDRDLTEEQKEAYRAEGRQPVLRMRMPDEPITFTDLVRGEITFQPGSVPDYVIVRANGDPLYTLVNPVDDALMDITHVLRGEDLLSSTPRQIVLYRALLELGIAQQMPEFGHLPYVMGEGNKKLSKRDPESNLLLHREKGMIREGLLNYLALLGWSISPDYDIFTPEEMIKAFDIHNVNPNPARFDAKKCIAINAEHIRRLDTDDFMRRCVPYLHTDGLVSATDFDALTDREKEILVAGAPLIQTRIQLLGEATGMLGFLFLGTETVEYDEKSLSKVGDDAVAVLEKGIEVLETVSDFTTETIEAAMRVALIDEMGLKPRFAFGPLRLAISGRPVSPPLFESIEILGKEVTIERFKKLSAALR